MAIKMMHAVGYATLSRYAQVEEQLGIAIYNSTTKEMTTINLHYLMSTVKFPPFGLHDL